MSRRCSFHRWAPIFRHNGMGVSGYRCCACGLVREDKRMGKG